jgi:hypothetical protein
MTKVNDELLSPDEIVATLRNSALPTLLVEGRSDMDLFQAVEDLCFENRIDILPAGSRSALFEVFKRRTEFKRTPVAFLADSDMFLFSNVPPDLTGIVFTDGYSIENDILAGGKALRLVGGRHRQKWENILASLARWFAAVTHRYLAGELVEYAQHPSRLVDFSSATLTSLSRSMLVTRNAVCPEARRVLAAPKKYLRGHTLLDALGHFMAETKHRPKCSKDVLLRIDLVSWETNRSFKRLIARIHTTVSKVVTPVHRSPSSNASSKTRR